MTHRFFMPDDKSTHWPTTAKPPNSDYENEYKDGLQQSCTLVIAMVSAVIELHSVCFPQHRTNCRYNVFWRAFVWGLLLSPALECTVCVHRALQYNPEILVLSLYYCESRPMHPHTETTEQADCQWLQKLLSLLEVHGLKYVCFVT